MESGIISKIQGTENTTGKRLISRINIKYPKKILDISYGPDNSSHELKQKWWNAEVLGKIKSIYSEQTDGMVTIRSAVPFHLLRAIGRAVYSNSPEQVEGLEGLYIFHSIQALNHPKTWVFGMTYGKINSEVNLKNKLRVFSVKFVDR